MHLIFGKKVLYSVKIHREQANSTLLAFTKGNLDSIPFMSKWSHPYFNLICSKRWGSVKRSKKYCGQQKARFQVKYGAARVVFSVSWRV